MEKEFVPYELSVKLKELGFDGFEVFGYYNLIEYSKKWEVENRINPDSVNYLEAPLWQQAFDWFTSKGYHSYIEGAYPWFRYYINADDDRYEGFKHLKLEEAGQACLEKLIELAEKENLKHL